MLLLCDLLMEKNILSQLSYLIYTLKYLNKQLSQFFSLKCFPLPSTTTWFSSVELSTVRSSIFMREM